MFSERLAPIRNFLSLTFLFLATIADASPRVETIGMTVSNLPNAVAFYTNVLKFEKISETDFLGKDTDAHFGIFGVHTRVACLKLGDESIELIEFLTPSGRPIPADSRSNDLWFQHIAIVVSDIDKAYAQLQKSGVKEISVGPQTLPTWNRAAGGIKAFYFQDPDHHNLELIFFPPAKGLAKWHEAKGKLFLGIDHTAIAVSNTERSLHFYRDQIGMHVAGNSENWGIEQERLNHVFGAHLIITALRGEAGPGVEFLQYLTPRDGRNFPADSHANDLWHWQIHIGIKGLKTLLSKWGKELSIISLTPENSTMSELPSVLIRDPDGHVLELGDEH